MRPRRHRRRTARIIGEGAPAELIAARLAPEAVELDCTPAGGSGAARRLPPRRHRLRVGGRLMLYLDDATPAGRRTSATRPRRPPRPRRAADEPRRRLPRPDRARAWRAAHERLRCRTRWRCGGATPRCTAAPGCGTSCRTSSSRCSTCCRIGIGVGAYITQMGGMSYAAFLAPGLVCVAAMNGASFEVTYNIFVRLTFEKAYDAMLTTPIEPDDVLAGEMLWAMTRACIYGGCFFIVVVPLRPRAAAARAAGRADHSARRAAVRRRSASPSRCASRTSTCSASTSRSS